MVGYGGAADRHGRPHGRGRDQATQFMECPQRQFAAATLLVDFCLTARPAMPDSAESDGKDVVADSAQAVFRQIKVDGDLPYLPFISGQQPLGEMLARPIDDPSRLAAGCR